MTHDEQIDLLEHGKEYLLAQLIEARAVARRLRHAFDPETLYRDKAATLNDFDALPWAKDDA
jgi:hypothetical protein